MTAGTTDDELRAFLESMRPWIEHVKSLKKGEFVAQRILEKFSRAIEFDRHTDSEIEVMKFCRDGFQRAMNVVIDHNGNPRTADELQTAAIDLAYLGWCMGLFVDSPDDLVKDKRYKRAIQRNRAASANISRRRWRYELEIAYHKIEQIICESWPSGLIYSKLKPLLPHDAKLPKDETVHKFICELRKRKTEYQV